MGIFGNFVPFQQVLDVGAGLNGDINRDIDDKVGDDD